MPGQTNEVIGLYVADSIGTIYASIQVSVAPGTGVEADALTYDYQLNDLYRSRLSGLGHHVTLIYAGGISAYNKAHDSNLTAPDTRRHILLNGNEGFDDYIGRSFQVGTARLWGVTTVGQPFADAKGRYFRPRRDVPMPGVGLVAEIVRAGRIGLGSTASL